MGLKKLEKTRLQKALQVLPSAPTPRKITVVLSRVPDTEDVQLKIATGTPLFALKRKVCCALDVPETSISRIEYRSRDDSSWYALIDEKDLADECAEQGGHKIYLRVVCVSLSSIVSAVPFHPVLHPV